VTCVWGVYVCVCVCWRLCVVCRAVAAAAAAAWRCHAPQIYVSLIDQLSSAPVSHTTLQTFFWRQVIAEIYCLLAWFSPFSDKTWCLRRPVYGFHERKIKATRNLVIANRSRVSCAYVTGMIFQGHLRSSEMSRFDSAYMISYLRFHSNYGPVLSFSRNSELMVENREFCIPQLYFNAPRKGWPHRNFAKMFRAEETRPTWLQYAEESWWYVEPFWIQCRNVTDRRTDIFTCFIHYTLKK